MSGATSRRQEPGQWAGHPLHAAALVARLGIDADTLSLALHISKRAAGALLQHNAWPRGIPSDTIRQKLSTLVQAHGATADDLESLFEPDVTLARLARGALPTDGLRAGRHLIGEDMLPQKQSLSGHARRILKLFGDPFTGPVERDEQFFAGMHIDAIREACDHCAATSGFMAVVGESGAGKTTIKEDLAQRLARRPHATVMIQPGVLGMEGGDGAGRMLKTQDILHAVITTLCPGVVVPQALQARTVVAHRMLVDSAQTGCRHLLVIDEAHALPDATLKHLKRLHEMRAGRHVLLGVLLLGQPELKRRLESGLRNGALREVAQRCEVIELPPLGRELGAYLAHRAASGGRELGSLMEPEAVAALQERLIFKTPTGMVNLTYPLAVGNAATAALNLAAEIGLPKVTADVVRAI
jgi:type II secretory pathway predicted ATPase ExeA